MTDSKWIKHAVTRLVDRHLCTHGRPESAAHIIEKYNVPDSAAILVSMDLNRRFEDRVPA